MLTSRADSPETLPAGTCRRYGTHHIPVRLDACLAWWHEPGEAAPADPRPFDLRPADLDPDATAEFASVFMPAGPEPRHAYALLLDIGLSGASVALDRVPPRDRPIYFRLEGDEVDAWIEAVVVDTTTTRLGPHLVRLAFASPCRFETIRSAICG